MKKWAFAGESVSNGKLDTIDIYASTLDEAIIIYHEKYPHLNFNKAVERRYSKARKIPKINVKF